MNGTKTDITTDSKARSIHSETGAIADTEAGATADQKTLQTFLFLQLSTLIVSTLLDHMIRLHMFNLSLFLQVSHKSPKDFSENV